MTYTREARAKHCPGCGGLIVPTKAGKWPVHWWNAARWPEPIRMERCPYGGHTLNMPPLESRKSA